MRLSKVQLIILSSAHKCTKNNVMLSLAQKGCIPPLIYIQCDFSEPRAVKACFVRKWYDNDEILW